MVLCIRYHVSRQTVRQALNLLTQEGLIEKRHGSGSYITGHSANLSDDQIAILISDDSNYIYPGVLDDIQGTLRKYHFSSQVHITKNETYEERKILTKLLSAPPRRIRIWICTVHFKKRTAALSFYIITIRISVRSLL